MSTHRVPLVVSECVVTERTPSALPPLQKIGTFDPDCGVMP